MALTITSKEPSTSRLVQSESGGHWYTENGESAHTVMGKNGNFRNTTVADARKMLLYPSVTSILSILDKPQLTNWKIEMAIIASLTLPKEEGETLEEYAKRVVRDSKESTSKAAEHGTLMHEQMEHVLLGRPHSQDEKIQPYIETFKKWADENVEKTYWCEKALVGAGYAGRAGLGRKDRDPEHREVLDGQSRRAHLHIPQAACVSIVLASNDSSKLMTRVWEDDELYQAGIAFNALLRVWAWIKGYTPPGMKL